MRQCHYAGAYREPVGISARGPASPLTRAVGIGHRVYVVVGRCLIAALRTCSMRGRSAGCASVALRAPVGASRALIPNQIRSSASFSTTPSRIPHQFPLGAIYTRFSTAIDMEARSGLTILLHRGMWAWVSAILRMPGWSPPAALPPVARLPIADETSERRTIIHLLATIVMAAPERRTA